MATAIEAPADAEGLVQHVPTTQAELFSLLDPDQIERLSAGLDPGRVQVHPETGMAHLEQWDVRRTLNQVFGFCGWSDVLKSIDVAYEETLRPAGQNQPANAWLVVYRAVVRLEIRNRQGMLVGFHEDVATGESRSTTSPGAAHDLASKTAQSQALKRAAVNWGDQFGLSLYNSGSVLPVVVPDAQAHVAGVLAAWNDAKALAYQLRVAQGARVTEDTVTTEDGEAVVLGPWIRARGREVLEEQKAAEAVRLAEQRANAEAAKEAKAARDAKAAEEAQAAKAAEEADRARQAWAAAPADVDWSTAVPTQPDWPSEDGMEGAYSGSVERHAEAAREHMAADPPLTDTAGPDTSDSDLAELSNVVNDKWEDLDGLVEARRIAKEKGLLDTMVPSESGRHHKVSHLLDTRIGELRAEADAAARSAAVAAPSAHEWVEPAGPLFTYAGSILDAEPPPAKRQIEELSRRAERGWDDAGAVEAVLNTARSMKPDGGISLAEERVTDQSWKEHVLGEFLAARIAHLRMNVGVAA